VKTDTNELGQAGHVLSGTFSKRVQTQHRCEVLCGHVSSFNEGDARVKCVHKRVSCQRCAKSKSECAFLGVGFLPTHNVECVRE
jgi:hypothetical protein